MKWFVRPFLVTAGVSSGLLVGDVLARAAMKTAMSSLVEFVETRQGEDK